MLSDAEYESFWAIGQALWPRAVEPGAGRVRQAWRGSLAGFRHDDLCRALERLAGKRTEFPSLAMVIDATREVARTQGEYRRLLPRPVMTGPVAVAEFDAASRARREEYRDEFLGDEAGFRRDGNPAEIAQQPWTRPNRWGATTREAWVAAVEAWIAAVGPWEEQARRLVAGAAPL